MTWVRLEDDFYDHGKFALAGPLGVALWVTAIAYCNRNLTDGVISRSAMKRLLDFDGLHWRAWDGELVGGCENVEPLHLADHLVGLGVFETEADAYRVHDYLQYQPSAQQVRAERAERQEAKVRAGRAGGIASGAVRRSKPKAEPKQDVKHTRSTPEADREANAKQNGSPVPVPKPVPLKAAAASIEAEAIFNATGPWLEGTSSSLAPFVQSALDKGYPPIVVKVGLVQWQNRSDRGPGLLPLLIDDAAAKHRPHVDPRPAWCGSCDELTRMVEAGDEVRRCPTCHPYNAGAA